MGVHKNRRFWTYSRKEQHRHPSAYWPNGLRFTSACPQCLLTFHEHLLPRDTCPDCGVRCVVTTSTHKENPNE